VEVDEECRRQTTEPQVGQHLGLVHREESLNGLDFDDELTLDDEVEAVTELEANALVVDGEGLLPLKSQAPERQFVSKALLIGRLEQARPYGPMHFDAGAYHFPRTIPKSSCLAAFLLHSSLSINGCKQLRKKGYSDNFEDTP
jgi:hypothetical protein